MQVGKMMRMRILITGAAGRVGRITVKHAVEAGHEVVATDVQYRADLPTSLHLADLLDHKSIYPLLEGCEALIHLGGYSARNRLQPDQKLLAENVATTGNVMYAAKDLGVRSIVLASSIQVITSHLQTSDSAEGIKELRQPPYLPLDGDAPRASGDNPYAHSKAAGELLLEGFCAFDETFRVSIARLPMIVMPEWSHPFRHFRLESGRTGQYFGEALAYLHVEDAADFLLTAATTAKPGCRYYLPAQSIRLHNLDDEKLVSKYLPQVKVIKPLNDGLVSLDACRAGLNWSPKSPRLVVGAD
jgi:nucleoside-diphosphate-sugar epimerase